MRHAVVITRDDAPTRVVHCDEVDQCLEVVRAEGAAAPAGTILNLLAVDGDTAVPLARWGVGRSGLKRGHGRRR